MKRVIVSRGVPRHWRSRFGLVLLGIGAFGCAHMLHAQLPGDNTATELAKRARAHFAQGRPDSALQYFRAALRLQRARFDRRGEGITLSNVGVVYDHIGHTDSALFYYRAALPIRRAVGDRQGEAVTLSNIGVLYNHVGQRDSALFYHRASLPLARALADSVGEANTLRNIGAVYDNLGQRDSALFYYRAALPLSRGGGDRAGEANTLSNMGLVYDHVGQRDSALSYYRASLPLSRAVGDRQGEAATLNGIGQVFANADEPDSALFYFRSAFPILRILDLRAAEATTLNNIGLVYGRTGRPDSAIRYYREALPIRRFVGDRTGEAATLNNIGLLFDDLGQRDSAISYYRAALSLTRAVGHRAGEAITLTNIARSYVGDPTNATNRARALAYFDSAAARSASVRAQSGGDVNTISFAETERDTFQWWAATWIDLAGVTTGPARDTAINSALAAAERGRAQGLRDLLMRKERNPSLKPGSAPKKRPAAATARLASAGDLSETDTVAGANLSGEAYRALAALRQSRTSLLYYLYARDTLSTWTLNPSGELRLLNQEALPSETIATLVSILRRGVGADKARGGMAKNGSGGDAEQESTTALSRGVVGDEPTLAEVEAAALLLSAQLLPSDLVRDVPARSEIVIVPQGVLGLIPFAALTVPGDSIPLGIRYALRYTPSLRALADAERQTPASNIQLVVGDPAMPTVTDATGVRVRLRDLPAAKAEGAKIAQRFGAALWTGPAASESAVREQLPNARLVHLATHGLAFGSEARVRDSYVALAPDAQNDGLLTIGELVDNVSPLSADLVVLSACQTGLGDLKQAEGTVGFQRAFLAKGARSVLVSLWSVDDKATALLMDRFYTHWLGADQKPAKSKAEALRLAQSDVRSTRGYESPRYWAAFQLVGAK